MKKLRQAKFLKKGFLAAAMTLAVFSAAAQAPGRPNIILILTDDLGWSSLSAAMDGRLAGSGSDYHETPAIDRMAREGMRFSRGYAPDPICTPSRRSIQFGQTSLRQGDEEFAGSYNAAAARPRSIAETLKGIDPSYVAAHFGKWDLRAGITPEHLGYDESDGDTGNRDGDSSQERGEKWLKEYIHENPKQTDSIAARAIRFMAKQSGADKPFYLQVSHYATHVNFETRPQTYRKFADKKKGARHDNAAWAGMIYDLDASIGRLFEALDSLGLSANTYVFFMADNGGVEFIPPVGNRLDPPSAFSKPMRNAPLRGGKWTLYEGGIRVPFIVKGPGIKAGTQSDVPVAGWDLLPTFCELAGKAPVNDNRLDGGSFAPLLKNGGKGKVARPSEDFYFHRFHNSYPHSAVISGSYKLIRFWKTGTTELYNLADDPGEIRNIRDREKARAGAMEKRLSGYIRQTNPGLAAKYSQTAKPGHVIIIMADQLRADVLGAQTPHIGALRKDAVEFERAYCASPLCAPSRASFFTGLYPNRTGSMINPWSKEDEVYGTVKAGIPSLYTMMEKSWDSRHVGKQHFFTTEKIDRRPDQEAKWITQEDYSRWVSSKKKDKPGGKRFKAEAPELVSGNFTRLRAYSTPKTELYKEGVDYFLDRYITNESIRAIKERDKSRPLLLNTMYLAPHPPFHIPDPYFSMYKPGGFHLPENVGRWYPGQSPLQMYSLTGFIGSRYSREQWDEIWAKYLGLVKLLDDELGRLIKTLREEGLYDDALIIFTSDHGEMLGSHSLWQKMCMYEESVRVPLIVKLPKGYPVKTRNVTTPVSLVDVLPTILDLNGVAASAGQTDGKSLLPLLTGSDKSRDPVFKQYDGNGSLGSAQRCLVDGDLKLIVDTFREEIFLEMYDMKQDPQETRNLALDIENEQLLNKLMTKLKTKMAGSGDRVRFGEDVK